MLSIEGDRDKIWDYLEGATLRFRERPIAVPGDLRPDWTLGLLLLCLRICCRGGASSVIRLHVLSWLARDVRRGDDILEQLKLRSSNVSMNVRFEPSVAMAVEMALASKLLTRTSTGRLKITALAARIADGLIEADDMFGMERQFLDSLGFKLSEDAVRGGFV